MSCNAQHNQAAAWQHRLLQMWMFLVDTTELLVPDTFLVFDMIRYYPVADIFSALLRYERENSDWS